MTTTAVSFPNESSGRLPWGRWGLRTVALTYLAVMLIIPLAIIFRDGLQEGLGGLWRAISHRGSLLETQTEHRAILAELLKRDPERARIRMSVHLLGVEQFSAAHADEDPKAV